MPRGYEWTFSMPSPSRDFTMLGFRRTGFRDYGLGLILPFIARIWNTRILRWARRSGLDRQHGLSHRVV